VYGELNSLSILKLGQREVTSRRFSNRICLETPCKKTKSEGMIIRKVVMDSRFTVFRGSFCDEFHTENGANMGVEHTKIEGVTKPYV